MKLNAYHEVLTLAEIAAAAGCDSQNIPAVWETIFCDLDAGLTINELRLFAEVIGAKFSIKFELQSGHFVAIGEEWQTDGTY